jgi:cytoskeletal protein CcmA (bactofilin family)
MAQEKHSSGATVIGRGVEVRGQIEGSEDVHVDGRIDGGMRLEGALVISERGVVVASVSAEEVTIEGVLVGDVIAQRSVQIGAKGKLVGDVKAGRLVIAAGGAMRGQVDTTEEAGAAPRRAARTTSLGRGAEIEEGWPRVATASSAHAPSRSAEAPPPPPRPAMAGKKKLTRKI